MRGIWLQHPHTPLLEDSFKRVSYVLLLSILIVGMLIPVSAFAYDYEESLNVYKLR
jgi:hypothetical protein